MGNSFGDSRLYHRATVKRSATLLSSSYVYTTAAASSKAREQKLQLERYWIESSMDIPRYNQILTPESSCTHKVLYNALPNSLKIHTHA